MFKYTTNNAFTNGVVPISNAKAYDTEGEFITGFSQTGEAVVVYAAYVFDTLEEALENCQKQAAEAIAKYQERIEFIKGIDFAGDFERKQRKAQEA